MKINKRIYLLFSISIFILCFWRKNLPNIYSQIITCCSIILGFTITTIACVYNKDLLNQSLREMGQLEDFLEYNQKFLGSVLLVLILAFAGSLLMWESKKIQFYSGVIIYFHMSAFVFLATMHMLYEAVEYINRFFQVYQNTYSNYAKKQIK